MYFAYNRIVNIDLSNILFVLLNKSEHSKNLYLRSDKNVIYFDNYPN